MVTHNPYWYAGWITTKVDTTPFTDMIQLLHTLRPGNWADEVDAVALLDMCHPELVVDLDASVELLLLTAIHYGVRLSTSDFFCNANSDFHNYLSAQNQLLSRCSSNCTNESEDVY